MATAHDVAKLAGVSQSTVSYVMSGTRTISAETRSRVEAAMRELSYHPNAGARALAGRRTNVVGLMARVPANTDVAALLPFIEAISSYCRQRDYDVVLVTEDEGPAGLERLAGRAIVDAIVLMDIRRDDNRLAAVRGLAVPAVLIGVPDDPDELDCVDYDVRLAGRLAVEELIGTGCRRIILIGEPPAVRGQDFGFIAQFASGVQEAAQQSRADFQQYEPDADGWAGFAGFETLVEDIRGKSVGVVARTPQAIDMVMQILQSHGVQLGLDASLVGICTDSTAQAFRRPVTNVSPEPRAVSQLAMKTLFGRLDGNEGDHEVRLVRPVLTRRTTTASHN